jgi:hypothetical protein
MADQKTLNGRDKLPSPAADVSNNVANFSHDLLTLSELQAQLFLVDLREGVVQSIMPLVLVVGGLALALGAIPVLLLGLGRVLVEQAGWSAGVSFLATSAVALALAGGLAWLGWRRLRLSLETFTRSKRELKENIFWIKQALKHRNTAHAAWHSVYTSRHSD